MIIFVPKFLNFKTYLNASRNYILYLKLHLVFCKKSSNCHIVANHQSKWSNHIFLNRCAKFQYSLSLTHIAADILFRRGCLLWYLWLRQKSNDHVSLMMQILKPSRRLRKSRTWLRFYIWFISLDITYITRH